jgi:DNA-binding NarL/FixJ family response regulator
MKNTPCSYVYCYCLFHPTMPKHPKIVVLFSRLLLKVVLMDIGLPNQNGIACVRTCRPAFPNIEYIMFTNYIESKGVFEALSVGASGYVLKGGLPKQLAEAIRDVKAGGSPMSRQISRMVTASQAHRALISRIGKTD